MCGIKKMAGTKVLKIYLKVKVMFRIYEDKKIICKSLLASLIRNSANRGLSRVILKFKCIAFKQKNSRIKDFSNNQKAWAIKFIDSVTFSTKLKNSFEKNENSDSSSSSVDASDVVRVDSRRRRRRQVVHPRLQDLHRGQVHRGRHPRDRHRR